MYNRLNNNNHDHNLSTLSARTPDNVRSKHLPVSHMSCITRFSCRCPTRPRDVTFSIAGFQVNETTPYPQNKVGAWVSRFRVRVHPRQFQDQVMHRCCWWHAVRCDGGHPPSHVWEHLSLWVLPHPTAGTQWQLCVLGQPVTHRLHTPRLHDGIEPTWQPQLCSAVGTHGPRGLQLGSNGVLESSRLALSLCLLLVMALSMFDLGHSEGSSCLLTLVPQGRVPWLTSQHRHWGHVLYELHTWSRRFS